MQRGVLDDGGAPLPPAHGGAHAVARPVPAAEPHVRVTLVTEAGTVTLASGRRVTGFTVNGTSPGPLLEATEGDLLEVRLRNASVADGTTLHWHGVAVPFDQDGVAGVTQDAVRPGQDFVYRFVVGRPGTYWYHSHQVAHAQVRGGLLGALVVRPHGGVAQDLDVLALTHTYDGVRTLNGQEGEVAVPAQPGQRVRLRLVNTDNALTTVWASVPYRVLAIDARDLVGPGPVTGQALEVTAGGRADLEVVVPAQGVARVQVGGASALLVGPTGSPAPPLPEQPAARLDLLTYGTPAATGLDLTRPDRVFDYAIGRRPGFVDGRPGWWWTVNGGLFPELPMFTVTSGDLAVFRIRNDSGVSHPMHLHGHHVLVLRRDGRPSTGSPWWADTLEVRHGQEFEVAFVADNPGVWMDHCHNLPHAREGLMAHVVYAGTSTRYEVGSGSGNAPE